MKILDHFEGDEYTGIKVKVIDIKGESHDALAYLHNFPERL